MLFALFVCKKLVLLAFLYQGSEGERRANRLCSKLHKKGGKMVLSEKKYPAFIKAYYPPNSRKSLKLPQPFTSFIKEMLPIKRVLLKDHYRGNFWAVEVEKIGSDFFFQAGWTRFLEDNCLEFGDFLVFQYNGDDEFRFKILRSTSESRDINIMGAMDFGPNELLQEVENMEEVVHEGTPTDKKNDISDGEKEEAEEVVVVEEEEEEAEEFEEEILIKNSGKRKVRSSGARTAKIEENSTYFAGMTNPAVEGQKGKNKSKYKDLRSNFNALQNPYFVANCGKNQTNQVYVPRDFGNAFRARRLPPEMVIRDWHGRATSTEFHIRKDKTMWMIGGWRQLALQNNVHYEDCLAFELVPMGGDQQESYIQLHIFRSTQGLQNP